MARKRQTTDKNQSQNTPDLQISNEEQWRLIEQSGVLKKVPTSDHQPTSSSTPQANQGNDDEEEYPLAEELFAATTLLIPMSFLLLMMYM
jgi:hypothetical protein